MSAQPAKASNRVAGRRQRRYPRFRSEFPVTVSLFSGRAHENLSAHCRDLSQGGIGMLIAAELNVGEVASLVFSLPTLPQPWNLRAVLRCRRDINTGSNSLLCLPSRVRHSPTTFRLWNARTLISKKIHPPESPEHPATK